jgi:hypothetical protein
MKSALQTLKLWAFIVFHWPTHRVIRLAPGLYLQVARGTPEREVIRALRAQITRLSAKKLGLL